MGRSPVGVQRRGAKLGSLAAGAEHTCAATSGSGVVCWGRNHQGPLGHGAGIQTTTPVDAIGRVLYLPIALG